MKHFRTAVNPEVSRQQIALNHRILTIGSCFSDAIGTRLNQSKIQALINPFGVIYNPVSLHKVLHYAVSEEPVNPSTFLKNQDIHLNYDFHSIFSSLHQPELEQHIRSSVQATHHFLSTCDWLIITYGTAWVYEHNETKAVVANCHKMPPQLFTKKLLQVDEIVKSFEALCVLLEEFNPRIRIILTVSPVRHIKDTPTLNSVSKAILRLACHLLAEKFTHVEYFPSYEIMMDDLRDYRFYKTDMLHPTEQAEDYIWDKFGACYLDGDARKFLQQWKTIQAALRHKPFHQGSAGHQNFLKQTLSKLEQLKSFVNVDAEIAALKSQLNS